MPEKKPLEFWEAKSGEQPPKLQPLIGLRVNRAWLSPMGNMLLVLLQGRRTLLVEPLPAVGEFHAIGIETGTAQENKDWEAVDNAMSRRDPHLKELRGRTLVGLDANVLVFSGDVGAEISTDGVRWVKVKKP